jgi:hypothetical protein
MTAPRRPRPTKKVQRRRSVSVWLFAWKKNFVHVDDYMTKDGAIGNRLYLKQQGYRVGPIIRVEVPP